MYSRRRPSLFPRLLSGAAIIFVVVVAFGLYEKFGHANIQEVVPTATRVIIDTLPDPGETKAPVAAASTPMPTEQLAIISEQASLSAPIREPGSARDQHPHRNAMTMRARFQLQQPPFALPWSAATSGL